MNDLLTAALRYAELGYPVFPCVPGDSKPLTQRGFHDASLDSTQIEQWWTAYPTANVAIAAEGLLVVDIDGALNPWPGPDRALDLATGPTAKTPGGGSHYVFRKPEGKEWRCTQGALAEHVDTRTDGGYFVAAPSRRSEGQYAWVPGMELDVPRDRLPEPPAWVVARLDGGPEDSPTFPDVAASAVVANQIPSGQRNGTLARLGGTMRRVGMSETEIGAALQQVNAARCVPPLDECEVDRIAESIARYEPDQIAVALMENHWEQMYADRGEQDSLPAVDPGPIPNRLLSVPGFVDEVMSYTLSTAPYPEPVLAFCGAIFLQALLAGRKVADASDNRTNLYVLGLANSGAGKDYPRKVNQKVLLEAGMSQQLGDTFASGEGIEDRMFLHPAVLFQTDEIDGLMSKINLGKDARHEGIMNVLLKMYTSANAFYSMRVKAGKEPGLIDQPCLCIFGTAIPKHYYEALSLKMLTNGFFARMLVLETGRRGLGQDARTKPLPTGVVDTAKWWAQFAPGGRHGNLSNWHPVPAVVETSSEAEIVLRAFREHADHEYSSAEERNDPVAMAIWARAHEKARRLALVYACSQNPRDLLIRSDGARWASEFVDHQTRRMLFMASESVCETEFDARCKKVVATLRTWKEQHGDAWMPFWRISRKHPWSEREHDEVRVTLQNQKLIEFDEKRTGGSPQRLYRLWA